MKLKVSISGNYGKNYIFDLKEIILIIQLVLGERYFPRFTKLEMYGMQQKSISCHY